MLTVIFFYKNITLPGVNVALSLYLKLVLRQIFLEAIIHVEAFDSGIRLFTFPAFLAVVTLMYGKLGTAKNTCYRLAPLIELLLVTPPHSNDSHSSHLYSQSGQGESGSWIGLFLSHALPSSQFESIAQLKFSTEAQFG